MCVQVARELSSFKLAMSEESVFVHPFVLLDACSNASGLTFHVELDAIKK